MLIIPKEKYFEPSCPITVISWIKEELTSFRDGHAYIETSYKIIDLKLPFVS